MGALNALGLMDIIYSSCAWIDHLLIPLYGLWRVYSDPLLDQGWASGMSPLHLHKQLTGWLPAFPVPPHRELTTCALILAWISDSRHFLPHRACPHPGPPEQPRKKSIACFRLNPENLPMLIKYLGEITEHIKEHGPQSENKKEREKSKTIPSFYWSSLCHAL